MSELATTHTLSVLVENKPGVLARVSSLIFRRGFNIESLAVGPTEYPHMSRITLAVTVDDLVLEQMTKQLNKLVEVLKIVELEPGSVRRELILIKVRAEAGQRSQVLEILQLFQGAKAVDITAETITIEAVGSPDKLEARMKLLEPVRRPSATGKAVPPMVNDSEVPSGVCAGGRKSRSARTCARLPACCWRTARPASVGTPSTLTPWPRRRSHQR